LRKLDPQSRIAWIGVGTMGPAALLPVRSQQAIGVTALRHGPQRALPKSWPSAHYPPIRSRKANTQRRHHRVDRPWRRRACAKFRSARQGLLSKRAARRGCSSIPARFRRLSLRRFARAAEGPGRSATCGVAMSGTVTPRRTGNADADGLRACRRLYEHGAPR